MVSKIKQTLSVLMNGILVGQLYRLSTGALKFTYDETWRNSKSARPISFSMSLESETYEGDMVYNFFDNLLPDNPSVRARLQAQFQAKTTHPFDLLTHIGKDCVGALQLLPDSEECDVHRIEATQISDTQIASVLKNYREAPLGINRNRDEFRISLAGAQEKSAFLFHNNKWCRPLGATPTTHIFKLPIGFISHQQIDLTDSCENEWLCGQIAKAFGLQVADSELKQFDDVKVLVSRRFDRKLSEDGAWYYRLPQEDMCQALGYSPNLKYQSDGGPGISQIMTFLNGSVDAPLDKAHFFKSQILFWLLAAIDGHAKNFSVFIEPMGRFRMTPLYDILSAFPLIQKHQLQKQKIKMAMALIGKNNHYSWHGLQKRHFGSTAKMVGFPVFEAEKTLKEMLEQMDEVIETVSTNLPKSFPSTIFEAVIDGMKSVREKLNNQTL